MLNLVNKIISLPKHVQKLQQSSFAENYVYQLFSKISKTVQPQSKVITVQTVEDLYYYTLFGVIVSSMRQHIPLKVDQLVFNSLALGESKTLSEFAKSRFYSRYLRKKWVNLYEAFANNIAYKSAGFNNPIKDGIDFLLALSTWRKVQVSKKLTDLMINDVLVGDLINDSFLRFKPAPSVDFKSIYLLVIIWQAYRDVRKATKYFESVKPSIFLTSYSTYVQHGIPVRIALKNGVRVFSFGNYQEFVKELTLSDWYHTKNTDEYTVSFNQLDEQQEKIGLAEKFLNSRFSGVIATTMSYMRHSAYAETGETVPNVKDKLVIFLHDFYDSPHIYKKMVFPDFWEWICFTVETLNNANINFVIKPHPNQINLNDSVLIELKKQYPSIHLISSKITNKQLVDAGMACAVTVYGTVANEMAYLGVPSIASAHHPHVNFGFCKTANTKAEYKELLQSFNSIKFDQYEMKQQSLVFNYMHHLNLQENEKSLMEALAELRQYNQSSHAIDEFYLQGLIKRITYNDELQKLYATVDIG